MNKRMKIVAYFLVVGMLTGQSMPKYVSASEREFVERGNFEQNILNCINNPEPITEIVTEQGVVNFTYDEEKNRVSKTRSGNTIMYYYQGQKLALESNGNTEISYFYKCTEDENIDRYSGFTFENQTYYYGYGDDGRINFLLDAFGEYIVMYEYDDLMRPISYHYINGEFVVDTDKDFIGNINPICYYGWYYDRETEHYYIGDGIYYNTLKQVYVHNAYSVDEEKLSDFLHQNARSGESEVIREITDYYAYVMSDCVFGTKQYNNVSESEWNSGKRWYDGIDRTELVARCIYAENTGENLKDERVAIAVVIANRVLYKSQDTSAYAAVTRAQQFASINPAPYKWVATDTANARKPIDKSNPAYQQAVLLAITICRTTDQDIIKLIYKIPDYIKNQTEFLKLNKVYEDNLFGTSDGQWYYYASWGTEKIKNVAVAGKDIFLNPTGTMESILKPYYKMGHNIFFEYGVDDAAD